MLKKAYLYFSITALLILFFSLSIMAFESDSFFTEEEQGPEFSYSGELFPEYRLFSDDDNQGNIDLDLELAYQTDNYDLKALIDYTTGARKEFDLAEAFVQYYAGEYQILLGKKRLVWGKGDKVHVVDQINAEDMSDFVNPDYLDRQLGEEMLKIDRYFRDGQALLEFVYTPEFTAHRLADDSDSELGNWVINPFASVSLEDISSLTGYSQSRIIHKVEDAFPDYNNQLALRFTDSRQGIDYGFTYYHGYLRDPSYDKAVLLSAVGNSAQLDSDKFEELLTAADLHYDEVDMLGAELATVWRTINTRFELAYFRTDDISGNDPVVRNNKIAWVIGGDRDLPISNLNLNVQFTGQKILDSAEIKDSGISDLEYNDDGDYTTNRLIVKLEDSYQNETVVPELTWIYNLEDEDYSLESKLDYKLQDDLHLELAHKIFSGDAGTTFGQFKDNDFTSLGLRYSF
ncbi:DUF1302 family protein [Halocella sp. SP3-1]|uniref:DUF1302 family protein n=1 Tax=Halocella sp. SP3-1 TaxID=2382161 RepID=UPI000F74C846|nr:DUF1302 family protein [Halocella sp. SP3-1]AZO95892.1 hypothetical protein D7D81_15560 [Halocella sp. SP3-1]